MYTLTVAKQFQLAGKSYVHSQIVETSSFEGVEQAIPVAQSGVLTVRTDTHAGSLTMDSVSHGIATGNKIDLYWVGGQRRGVTVGTVAGAVVPIDTGAGTDLPAATTVIQAAVVQVIVVSITGDNVLALLGACDLAKCTIVLMKTGGTVEHLPINLAANLVYEWVTGDGTDPLAGVTIDAVHLTHADTVTAQNMRIGALINV